MKDHALYQIKLSQLRALVTVAEQHSFSTAAQNLNMSQSAVSHAIASLESILGVMLLSRNRTGTILTPVGKHIVAHARVILERSGEIVKEAALVRGLEGGQVRLASFRSVAAHLLPDLMAAFHQRFPAITLSLTEHEDYLSVEQALRERRADIGFTFLPADSDFETWELFQDEYVALFPPSFQPSSSPLHWLELLQLPLILPPAHDVMMKPVFTHIREAGYSLKATYEVETDAAIVSLVAQGLGATILPRLAAEPISPAIQVRSLPVPLIRRIGTAVVANGLNTPAVYAFLSILDNHHSVNSIICNAIIQ